MRHLVFVEDRAQADWIKQSLTLTPATKLVAVTADALQALEEAGLPHEAVAAYADTRQLAPVEDQINRESFSLAREIESFIAHRHPDARFEGPGFLSGQGYYLQFSVSAVVTRGFLMRETIRVCSPQVVTVFVGNIDPWFSGDGYKRNPWVDVLVELAAEMGFRLEVLEGPLPDSKLEIRSAANRSTQFMQRASRYARRRAFRLIQSIRSNGSHLSDLAGLRLLFAESLGYDWAPVLAALRLRKSVECFSIDATHLDTREWTYYYVPTLRHLWNGVTHELNPPLPQTDEAEAPVLLRLFDEWLRDRPTPVELNILGMNLFSVLLDYLRALVSLSPAIVRHTDVVANRALDIARPHAVCFYSMPSLAAKRFAFWCRQRGVPVVCYQHGPNYGTQRWVPHEQTELAHADYFLTYGTGIRPPLQPVFPTRARYVPVGSARVESMLPLPFGSIPSANKAIHVLWIAAVTTGNTIGGPFDFEDTSRVLLQKQCLELLDRSDHLRVTYRPYRHQVARDGTTRWLELANLRSVQVEATGPLEELIRKAHIIITDTPAVSSAWVETIALRKPMILYSDPEQTRLWPDFATDLERTCMWCKSCESFVAAIQRLIAERWEFIAELHKLESSSFKRQYIL
ncbi:MAG: hypothetical protein ACE5IY_15990, partial [bacterium]